MARLDRATQPARVRALIESSSPGWPAFAGHDTLLILSLIKPAGPRADRGGRGRLRSRSRCRARQPPRSLPARRASARIGADLSRELVPSVRQCEEVLTYLLRRGSDRHVFGFFGEHSVTGRAILAVLRTLLVVCHEPSPSLRAFRPSHPDHLSKKPQAKCAALFPRLGFSVGGHRQLPKLFCDEQIRCPNGAGGFFRLTHGIQSKTKVMRRPIGSWKV